MRRLSLAFQAFAFAAVLASSESPSEAAEAVDLELILAVDVSGSIDYGEARLQREGYVNAIVDPEVMAAIRSGMLQRIALMYIEWAGDHHQRIVVGWTLIEDEAGARAFSAALADAPIATERFTSISSAIDYAVPRFAQNDFEGTRRVIDISGDGPNNVGRFVQDARDDAVAAGIIINGLPILNTRENSLGFPNLDELDLYYQDCVIGGPGAFTVRADSFEAFATAIRRKLILEIAGLQPGGGKAPRGAPPGPPARAPALAGRGLRPLPAAQPYYPDCEIGERQLIDFLRSRDISPF